MKILPLADNAIFLQNWRERMRFSAVVSATMICSFIVFLIFVNSYLNPDKTYSYRHPGVTIHWLEQIFWYIAIMQGVILLLMGTFSADRMSLRERASGTLDFHRASPTPRINHYIGLVFGSTSLEWCLFLGLAALNFILLFFTSITIIHYLKFYFSLMLCAVLLHSAAALLGVAVSRRGVFNQRRFGGILIFFILYSLSGLLRYSDSLPVFYHMTWFPAYDQLHAEIFRAVCEPQNNPYCDPGRATALSSFFFFKLPTLLLQLVVQLPLLVFTSLAVSRKIAFPERPFLSKTHFIFLTMFLMVLYVGSVFAMIANGKMRYNEVEMMISLMLYFAFMIGFTFANSSTPTQLQYIKGLEKAKKLGKKSLPPEDDYSSNLLWSLGFMLVVAGSFLAVHTTLVATVKMKLVCLALFLSYFFAFTSALEWFRLSKYHQKSLIFWSVIGILWMFVPIFGEMIKSAAGNENFYYFLRSLSPFWINQMISEILGTKFRVDMDPRYLYMTLGLNFILAFVMQNLAAQERLRLRKSVFEKPA